MVLFENYLRLGETNRKIEVLTEVISSYAIVHPRAVMIHPTRVQSQFGFVSSTLFSLSFHLSSYHDKKVLSGQQQNAMTLKQIVL